MQEKPSDLEYQVQDVRTEKPTPAPKNVFLDRTMNRQQNRAARAVLRRIARIKGADPMLVMGAFQAARNRGWCGPDTQKAVTFQHPRVAKQRPPKVNTGWTKVWTKKKARKLAKQVGK